MTDTLADVIEGPNRTFRNTAEEMADDVREHLREVLNAEEKEWKDTIQGLEYGRKARAENEYALVRVVASNLRKRLGIT